MRSHGGLVYGRRTMSDLRGNAMTLGLAQLVIVIGSLCPLWAAAQATDLLPPTTQLVTASGAAAATQETFTIASVASGSTQPDLIVTFTDFQTPAALSTASVVVTQGASIVGTTTLAAPATTATVALPAAAGQYELRVIGTPNAAAGVGTFSVCVAPKVTPAACISDASLAGNITVQSAAANPTVSTLGVTLTVAAAGAYTFTYTDKQFPVALSVAPSLALFQGSQPVAVPVPASPATITLSPGSYTLLAVAQADPTAQAGLYGITITGPAGVAPLLDSSYPVGLLAAASQPHNPSAQSVTLTVTDFAFPSALSSAIALVTNGGTTLGTASAAAGASAFAAPAGSLQVWTYGAAGTAAGTYEVDLTSASSSLLQSAFGVSTASSFAYAFVSPTPLTAGSYQATANDFEFPAPLLGLQFAVAQDHAILKQSAAVGSLNFTATAHPVVLLVDATPTANSNGLFDVNVQMSGSSLVFDRVQTVSASGGFTSQPITLGTSGNFDVTLTDLEFPAQFASLALVGTSNGTVLGHIYGGGTFTIAATPGNYQFTVIAIPAATQQYGLYGIQIVDSPPTVTLTASPASLAANSATTLSWTTVNAASCIASGGAFTGSQATVSGSTSVIVAATTTYTLTCTGPGGSTAKSATVTATAAPAKSGGGGMGLDMLGILGILALVRARFPESSK
jgi:hypothetical protein